MMNMVLKIHNSDGTCRIERAFGTPEEIAKNFFTDEEINTIDVLDGGTVEDNENFYIIIAKFYRVPETEVKEFNLYFNIRYERKTIYKYENCKEICDSCGVARV